MRLDERNNFAVLLLTDDVGLAQGLLKSNARAWGRFPQMPARGERGVISL